MLSPGGAESLGGDGKSPGTDEGGAAGAGCVTAGGDASSKLVGPLRCVARYASARLVAKNNVIKMPVGQGDRLELKSVLVHILDDRIAPLAGISLRRRE